MQLIGCRNALHRNRGVVQSRDKRLLPLVPWRFRRYKRIGTAFHDVGHFRTKAMVNLRKRRPPALIFGGVVQQCGNGLIFRAAVFHHQRAYRQQMRQIRLA